MRSLGGHSGLWFGNTLEVDLGAEVDSITLGLAGIDASVVVQAFGASGDSRTVGLILGQEAEITLSGSRIDRIQISNGADRTVLTRLCTARPQALPGGDLHTANVLTIGV